MADFEKAFDIVQKLEYSDCSNALHRNPGEDGYTFMGIYQKAHPNSPIWKEMKNYFRMVRVHGEPTKNQLREVSRLMCGNGKALDEVRRIYKKEYWDRARLDEVKDQKIAEEIFVFGVNAGMDRAIKLAQKIVGVKADGVVGPKTLASLNSYNGNLFDILFDAGEAKYYESLVKAKKRFAKFKDGWFKRAKAV